MFTGTSVSSTVTAVYSFFKSHPGAHLNRGILLCTNHIQTEAVLKKSKRKEVSYKIPRLTEAPWESWWAGGLGGRLIGTEMGVELMWDDTQYLACSLGQGGNSGGGAPGQEHEVSDFAEVASCRTEHLTNMHSFHHRERLEPLSLPLSLSLSPYYI